MFLGLLFLGLLLLGLLLLGLLILGLLLLGLLLLGLLFLGLLLLGLLFLGLLHLGLWFLGGVYHLLPTNPLAKLHRHLKFSYLSLLRKVVHGKVEKDQATQHDQRVTTPRRGMRPPATGR